MKKYSTVNWWRNLNMWATLGRRRMGHFSSCWDLLQIFVLQSLYSTKWGWIKPKKDSAPIRLDWEVLLLKKFRCIAIMITQVNSECWLWSRNNVKCIKPTPANDRPITVCIKWCGNISFNWQLVCMDIQIFFHSSDFCLFADRWTIFVSFLNCEI